MKKKIVILEFEDSVRQDLEGILAGHGYEVYGAVDGAVGLNLVSDVKPDLIILNPLLPALSGYAVMDVLRAKGSTIPVLAITSESNLVDNLAHQDVAGILLKPIDPDKLAMHVDAIMKLREASGRLTGPVNDVWKQEEREIDDKLSAVEPIAKQSGIKPETPPPTLEMQIEGAKDGQGVHVGGKLLVLIVEDEPDMRGLVASLLRFKGFEVSEAVDGQDALIKTKKEMPNVIVLDVMLPKMDGYQVCRMLKFDEKFRRIPVIMLTARQTLRDKEIAMASGADGFIAKPFSNEALLGEIARVTKNIANQTSVPSISRQSEKT